MAEGGKVLRGRKKEEGGEDAPLLDNGLVFAERVARHQSTK